MENISLVSWDDMFVLDEALAQEWGRLVDQINAHEMAHSYFGDLVVIRDFADAWLKESWATYMEACWIEHAYGAEEYAYEIYECAQRYLHEADERYLRPIVTRRFDSSWQLFDAHLYPGGAVRLHMLRRLLGMRCSGRPCATICWRTAAVSRTPMICARRSRRARGARSRGSLMSGCARRGTRS